MADYGFLQIFWLWLLPLPVLWLMYRFRQQNPWPRFIPSLVLRYPNLVLLKEQTTALSGNDHQKAADRQLGVALVLFILALAQPVRYADPIEAQQQHQAVDLVVLVGTAISMVLKDYVIEDQAIDRMTMARRLLDGFVTDYSGQRIGLTLMGNPPMLWLPFTHDKAVVKDAISRIRPALAGRLTDMGASLELVADNYHSADDKVVVMITDGGLQLGKTSPQQAAKKLAEKGYTLYVIAIGSANKDNQQADKASLIYEPINLPLLTEVAEAGQGKLFHVLDIKAFQKALNSIENKHQKNIKATEQQRLVQAAYPIPLALGIFLVLFASLGRPFGVPKDGAPS